jgi:hypothetical protein
MPNVSSVMNVFNALSRRDIARAAGNQLLSIPEQRNAPPHVQAAAQTLRDAGSARVTVAALATQLEADAMELVRQVNQPTGQGHATLSFAEAKVAQQRNPQLGLRLLQAYQIEAGKGPNTDSIANAHAAAFADPGTEVKLFATVQEAEAHRDPNGASYVWLVKESASVLSHSYVWGRNDLWAQRFDVDRADGSLTITGEH